MKIVVFSFIFACLVFPAFSQSANSERFRALDDSMSSALSDSNSRLKDFDQSITDTGNLQTYVSYKQKYDFLTKALQESGSRLDRLMKFNDRTANIKAERDNYESLIKKLEAVKSDYDNWLKTVQ